MKKSAVIFLLGCLAAPYIMQFVVLDHNRSRIRREVKQHLARHTDPDNLVTFVVSLTDSSKLFKWIHAHEFEFNGHMYDVVRSTTFNDTIAYICWPDDKETKLNKQLAGLLATAVSNSPVQQKSNSRWDTFSRTFVFILPDNCLISNNQTGNIRHTSGNHTSNHLVSIDTPYPPPKYDAVFFCYM